MKQNLGTGLIILVFFLSLVGTCCATDSPRFLATLTGGESTIVNDTNETMIITVQNPDPYANITKEDNTTQISVDLLQYSVLPINAVTVFSGPETKTVSTVKIENISISNNAEILTLKVKPLQFYDGELLSSYAKDTVNLQELEKKSFNSTGLYLEMVKNVPENWQKPENSCDRCKIDCHGSRSCELECDVLCME